MLLNIKSSDKILVISPHPDDETIGCGALLTQYGSQCDILLLTDGRKGHLDDNNISEDELVKIREHEFLSLADKVKVNKVEMLHIHDSELSELREKVYGFNLIGYDLIFIPNRNEFHPDHAVVYDILKHMQKRQHVHCEVYEYEVWSPLSCPSHFLTFDNLVEYKLNLIEVYATQLACRDYRTAIKAICAYRGFFIKSDYAEAYSIIQRKSIKRLILNKIPFKVRKFIHRIFD